MKIGIVEGFFGPAWPSGSREGYAAFLAEYGGDFFIYAPKQDQHLRKGWREEWDSSYLSFLSDLSHKFKTEGVAFGVGLSPFGLGESLADEDQTCLIEKIRLLSKAGIDLLGLFFDDMPTHPGLARVQGEVVQLLKTHFQGQIIFCPSYYTPDPILEKVFGKMPDRYLEDIAEIIPKDISIAWTGPKVISPAIPREHMLTVKALLKRSPFIWENLFANDGPRNCKFLKLRPFTGREEDLTDVTEGWGLNMMNQPELSKITFLASLKVLREGVDPELAFEECLTELCGPALANFIRAHRITFLEKGLDNLTDPEKEKHLHELATMPDPAAREIEDWLRGLYVVGSECLTD